MHARTASVVALGLATTWLAAPASGLDQRPDPSRHRGAAGAERVFAATDATGDVRFAPGAVRPGPRAKRSIDIERVMAKVRDGDSVRFVFDLRDVHRSDDYDQIVLFTIDTTRRADEPGHGEYALSVQSPDLASARSEQGGEESDCGPLTAQVLWKREAVRLDVPLECVPAGPTRVRVTTLIGEYGSEIPGVSHDDLLVPRAQQFWPGGVNTRRD